MNESLDNNWCRRCSQRGGVYGERPCRHAGCSGLRSGERRGGDFLYRETDSEITSDSFVKRIYQSDDDGDTWVEGDYYFRFERVRR